MKRYIILILSLIMFFTLLACGSKKEKSRHSNTTKTTTRNAANKKQKTEKEEIVPIAKKDPIPSEQLEKAKEIIAAVSTEQISKVEAKKTFKMYCASCHGFNGRLKVNGAADLHKSSIPLEERVAQIYFGRKLMTPFKGVMTGAEIVAVAKYIETLR